jgi:uncharacterized protein (DUF2147 family)
MSILLAVAMWGVPAVCAAGADEIVGTWDTGAGTSFVRIVRCGDAYCGDIAWIQPPACPPEAERGAAVEPQRDTRNPDPALRGRPLLGLRILKRFSYRSEDAAWTGGDIYDPEQGKTYSARMRLLDRDRLELRGYIGIPLFGRTVIWTRAHDEAEPVQGPAPVGAAAK